MDLKRLVDSVIVEFDPFLEQAWRRKLTRWPKSLEPIERQLEPSLHWRATAATWSRSSPRAHLDRRDTRRSGIAEVRCRRGERSSISRLPRDRMRLVNGARSINVAALSTCSVPRELDTVPGGAQFRTTTTMQRDHRAPGVYWIRWTRVPQRLIERSITPCTTFRRLRVQRHAEVGPPHQRRPQRALPGHCGPHARKSKTLTASLHDRGRGKERGVVDHVYIGCVVNCHAQTCGDAGFHPRTGHWAG